MRVRIAVTVEVDAEAWRKEYSLVDSVEVREDVKGYCETAIAECYAAQSGLLKIADPPPQQLRPWEW